MTTELFRADDEGIVLAVHVQPAAGRSGVVGRHGDALKVKVGAPPADGRANAAVLALVADAFGVKESAVSLLSGATSRSKRLRLQGVGAAEARSTLERLLSGHRPVGRAAVGIVDRSRRAT